MIHFVDITKENIKEHKPHWLQILDHPNRLLITGGSGFGKISSLSNLMSSTRYWQNIFIC